MKQIIVKNLWLKALALFFAILTWFYVVGELNKGTVEERALFERIIPYKLAAKAVPVKLAVVGRPRRGYQVATEAISVKPSTCVILAPQNLLKNIEYLVTEDVDIGEFTKPIVKEIRLKPVASGIVLGHDFFVTAVIPIKKIELQEEAKK